MSSNNRNVPNSSAWRKRHFENLEALKLNLAESRLSGQRILASLPEPDRKFLLSQIAAVLDWKAEPGENGGGGFIDATAETVLGCQAAGLIAHPKAVEPLRSDTSGNLSISVLQSPAAVEEQTESSDSRLEQLEMQLEACLDTLAGTEDELLEAEIRVKQLNDELAEIRYCRTWRIALKLQALRYRLAPAGSLRAKTARISVAAMRGTYRMLRHPPLGQLPARLLGFVKSHTPKFVARFVDRHRNTISKFLPERAREFLRVTADLAENLRTPLADRLDEFINAEVAENSSRRLFVFFSGTTFTESEGQRPTRLARELARRGIPVLFCYWRWKTSEPPQVAKFPHVFCLPIDEFLKKYEKLMSDARLGGLKRSFLMEFPHPALLEVVNYANAFGWKTVYDAIDDWEEFEKCGQAVWYDRDFEAYLMRNADLATITCPTLLDKLRPPEEPQRCRLLPNAFEDWACQPDVVKKEKAKGKITIGYFGHLTSSWFDWPLVVETAKRHPDWIFQIIGYGMDAKIEPLPNIVHLGKVEHRQLPSHANAWDVAMIPFKPSRLSAAVDPIKIYEYIALRLTTVVTGMPHLASYPGVFTAETIEQFEAAVEAAATRPLNEEEVAEFLGENRWANRVDELLQLLDQPENRSAVSRALLNDEIIPLEKAA